MLIAVKVMCKYDINISVSYFAQPWQPMCPKQRAGIQAGCSGRGTASHAGGLLDGKIT